jgi:hypothetical protein
VFQTFFNSVSSSDSEVDRCTPTGSLPDSVFSIRWKSLNTRASFPVKMPAQDVTYSKRRFRRSIVTINLYIVSKLFFLRLKLSERKHLQRNTATHSHMMWS